MVEILKGCKECQALTELNKCPHCGGKISSDWSGYFVIIDHTRSRIAKKMAINFNGKFALKVR
ncbi:MAG: transcription elongation factor subunit Spt4 [Candidatus Thermoplasmatota archaeon]|jgi:DNA-directed RNA polymerase subunit E"|nr:transcription elongation factor subunit Spt4 [Candidatus Thermoplasmatota archaeon]MDP7264441.1 transcription elongation factor subunit Spt4 [Candidatus Thermoplasmatota archaeon]